MALQDRINEALAFISPQLSEAPELALILGSGLGGLAEAFTPDATINYNDIPHFKSSSAPGHVGRLLFGHLHGKYVACMQGRLHYYEGNAPEDTVFPLRVLNALGANTLIVTNASGGVNLGFDVGDIMLITDHINLMGANPLTFGLDQNLYDFQDMSYAYSRTLAEHARNTASEINLPLRQGIYLAVRGPSFETPAEIKAFRTLGADAVGMSTVFEVIVANQLNMQVLGLSLITNMAAGVLDQPLSGDDVVQTAATAASKMQALVLGVIQKL